MTDFMQKCKECNGRGVRQLHPGYAPDGSVKTTRALWPWTLCQCVLSELVWLRGFVTGLRSAVDALEKGQPR